MSVHVIRLRGFWAVEPLADGRTRHRRRLGRPRALEPGETAWLVWADLPGPAAVSLNGEPVGAASAAGPWAVDVTGRLQPRNEVTVEVDAGPDAPLGDVAVEVRGG